VRAFLAALLTALILAVVVTDPLACPDGCADEDPAAALTLSASSCSFCHGWSCAAAVLAAPAPVTRTRADAGRDLSLGPAFVPRIDHPPRLA
jgi:hypothetical protein